MEKIGKIISCRHVPEDLVIEFLLRLPVKSLVRFKTLSKYWYNLITSCYFIYKHLRINNRTRILADRYLGSSTTYNNNTFGFTVSLYESLSHHHRHLAYFSIPSHTKYVLGPINGLFLLGNCHQNNGLALFNPATRELKTLFIPNSNLLNPSFMHRFGFGFDPLKNDFKVVAFWNTNVDGLLSYSVNMAVYSLSNDSWKHLSPGMHNLPCPGIDAPYMNGSCYWLSNNYSILSFDFCSETLGEFNGPQHIPISEYIYASLFIYNYDSLAMFIGTYQDTNFQQQIGSIDILIMKEGCWTKHLTLDVSLLDVLRPVGVWKNKLLLETVDEYDCGLDEYDCGLDLDDDYDNGLYKGVYTTKLVMYNLTTDETKELDIHPHYYKVDRRVLIYNESLVSLKGSFGNNNVKDKTRVK